MCLNLQTTLVEFVRNLAGIAYLTQYYHVLSIYGIEELLLEFALINIIIQT